MFLFSFLPLIIIGLIIFGVVRFFRGEGSPNNFLQGFFSKEDAMSQMFFLFSMFFLGITLFSFNKQFAEPIPPSFVLLIVSLVGLAISYYYKLFITLLFSLIGIVNWWSIEAMLKAEGKDIKGIAILSGILFITFLFYLIGRIYESKEEFKRFSIVLLALGILPITFMLFIVSMKDGLLGLGELTEGASLLASWEITLSLFLFLLALITALIYTVQKRIIFPLEAGVVALFAILFAALVLLPEQAMSLSRSYRTINLSGTGVFWAIVFNLLLFIELIGFILFGYARRKNFFVNFGAFLLFLFILIKYFDWFFSFLDKSVFFIGAGLLLFGVGLLMERGRRYMISAIKTK